MVSIPALPKRLIDIHSHLRDDDPDGSKCVEQMDSMNIGTSLVMGSPINLNKNVLAAVGKYPGRLVGGAYIDPRSGRKSLDEVRFYYDKGLRVVKLFPNLGYYPDDDVMAPFFEMIAELGMAVLSHCGWLGPQIGVSAAYYSHPGRFEKVIRRHPETPFIMAHMGGIAGFLETVMLTTRTPNTYTDCSPGQGQWVLECTGAMAGSIPSSKLMWGLDCAASIVDRQREALAKLGFGPEFDKVFFANARAILEKVGALPAE